VSEELIAAVRGLARPLLSGADLNPLLDRIGNARFVLLGEASHGTREYYTWRAEISRRLITQKGFSFIAVEGDWPDCYRLNRYLKGYDDSGDNARDVLHAFDRWPTWMWANEEVVDFAEWLRHFNHGEPDERKVGFYGLDVYSLWDSLHEVMGYLGRVRPDALPAAHRAFRCFEPYGEDVQKYARSTMWVPEGCEAETVDLLRELRAKAPKHNGDGRDGYFVAEQNALVVKNAKRTTGQWFGAGRTHGTSATATWPRRSIASSAITAQMPRRSSGSTTRTLATPATPTWPPTGW